MASNSLVKVKNLSWSYGSRMALSDISFNVDPGESVALIGPNGSGKSTLIKALSGAFRIREEISIKGQPLSALSVKEIATWVAVVPQEEHFPFRFAAFEVVAMGRLAKSHALFDTDEDRKETIRAMEFCDCLKFAERPITELSGGEKQRVLIARAVAQDTPILLLDEPATHLDVLHQVQLFELIARLREEGKTIITSSHDLNQLGRISNRAILLEMGKLVLDSATADVLNSPELDRVYGVQFERVSGNEGRVLVPRAATS